MTEQSCSIRQDIPGNKELIEKLHDSGIVNVFLLNLDNFSNINNAYGYEIGDKVLCNVAKYIKIVKPHIAQLYRFSSDKFVLLDERKLSDNELREIAESILSFFSHTEIIVDDIELKISLSIGISTAKGLENIIQAEMAVKELRMYKRNSYNFFDENSSFVARERQNVYWIRRIKEAVINEDIVVYFQPIINNYTKKIEKYECLARIRDENMIISPYVFMQAAKVTGSLPYVTRAIINQSFQKFSQTEYEFSINLSGEDFMLDYLEDYLLRASKKHNIDPKKVVLEMLEDISSLGDGTIMQQLDRLRAKGFKIAIDDFGAESSNMSRLLEIHPEYLKIDGAFIKNIVDDENSQIIVESIVLLCKNSGIKVIAEFIHNKEVQEKVKFFGIEYSQGYYFGEPKPDLIELTVDV